MKVFITLLAMVAFASADDFDLTEAEADPRLFFVNFTSSLVTVNTTLLPYGLIFQRVHNYLHTDLESLALHTSL